MRITTTKLLRKMQLQKLNVNATQINPNNSTQAITFACWEFTNDAILLPGDNCSDFFFENRASITLPNITINSIEETTVTTDLHVDSLEEMVNCSIRDYGQNAVPASIIQLIADERAASEGGGGN